MATGELTQGWGHGFHLVGTPVLMYHGLTDGRRTLPAAEARYWVLTDLFREQLASLSDRCIPVLSLQGLCEGVSECRGVVLTFDDGFCSDYHDAWPLLMEARMAATFFLNSARVGTEGYLTWKHIVEMSRSGMQFGSHGHEHLVLTRMSSIDLRKQLQISKATIEDRIGTEVRFLSAPYGLVNRRVTDTAFDVGYLGVCTSRPWPARAGGRVIGRAAIYGKTTIKQFRQLSEGRPAAYLSRTLRHAMLSLPKELMLRISPDRLGVGVVKHDVSAESASRLPN